MSTREQIIIERKATNIPPHTQLVTKCDTFYNEAYRIKGNRKHLLEQARQLAKIARIII